jgi:3-hydroxybutyryl-CoA dehydrogenase
MGTIDRSLVAPKCSTAHGHPLRPFELMDLTGIDIGYHIEKGRDPRDLPGRSVTELVERGELGRRTGKCWRACDQQDEIEGTSWTSR